MSRNVHIVLLPVSDDPNRPDAATAYVTTMLTQNHHTGFWLLRPFISFLRNKHRSSGGVSALNEKISVSSWKSNYHLETIPMCWLWVRTVATYVRRHIFHMYSVSRLCVSCPGMSCLAHLRCCEMYRIAEIYNGFWSWGALVAKRHTKSSSHDLLETSL